MGAYATAARISRAAVAVPGPALHSISTAAANATTLTDRNDRSTITLIY